ncbi:MAG: LanC-like protein [Gaiellales bacterium]
MAAIHDPDRHEPLVAGSFDEAGVRARIGAIAAAAEAAFHSHRLWPTHPEDDDPTMPEDGILRGVHVGAAGMLHGLHRLTVAGLHAPSLDLAAIADELYAPSLASPDEPDAGSSLLVGTSGILLVAHELAPSSRTADQLAEAIAANCAHPANELLLGAPGTMLAAAAMHSRTGEERFADLWRASARVLLARREPDGLWTQHLYGSVTRYLGAAHGLAGIARALLGGRGWLADATDVELRIEEAIRVAAQVEAGRANWPELPERRPPRRTQWCHGAAGIVLSLAPVARAGPLDDLLVAAGEAVWAAGPLSGGAGLCHGTAGNGFALLALHARTGDAVWLERAQAFAVHALDQVDRFALVYGRPRFTLMTGDLGPALLAASCLQRDARFPGIDDW